MSGIAVTLDLSGEDWDALNCDRQDRIERAVREQIADAYREMADKLGPPRFEAALSLDGTGTWDVLDHERRDVIQFGTESVARAVAADLNAGGQNPYGYGPSHLYPKGA